MDGRKIAVAGATGRVGRHVVDVVTERGYEAVAMSRANGVDLISGDGLAEVLAGVTGVIDAATYPLPDEKAATEFFTTAARNLHETGRLAELAGLLVAHRGQSLRIEEVENPDDPDAKLFSSGALLPGPGARLVGPTFREWLAGD